jgi:four helix bundle protein
MELEHLEVYKLSLIVGENVWAIVTTWGYFEKDTMGKQMVRAADSKSANISEGYGRFHYRDMKQFLYYARGSLYETKTWALKAKERGLLSSERFLELENNINILGIKLNKFINSIGLNKNTS